MPTVLTGRGFTLIELLIVVSIIALLAAIAVPNFLEAQIRGKVARVRSDLRSLATALESYAVDANAYPPHLDANGGEVPYPGRYVFLTTPVAYVASIPSRDPFFISVETQAGAGEQWYSYTNISSFPATHPLRPVRQTHRWILRSRGPDGVSEPNSVRNAALTGGIAAGPSWLYDPTNGSVSRGDLVRTALQN